MTAKHIDWNFTPDSNLSIIEESHSLFVRTKIARITKMVEKNYLPTNNLLFDSQF